MAKLFTLLVLGALAVGALWLVITLVGALISGVLSLTAFLLFTVAPIILVGWVAWKVFGAVRRPQRLSAADRRWLERGD